MPSIDYLNDRIAKAKEKIAKAEKSLARYQKLKADNKGSSYIDYDIRHKERELDGYRSKLSEYEGMLNIELDKKPSAMFRLFWNSSGRI